jgi:putative tryptophan/tyrosine transport system substrate-binding protein
MTRHSRRQVLQGSLALVGLGLMSGCAAPAPPEPRLARPARIGVLAPQALDPSPEGTAFREGLSRRGYAEGRNLTIQARNAATVEGLHQRAEELVALKPDVIVTVGNEAGRATREATGAIPITMVECSDPVGDGLVASLGRPGANVTGVSTLGAQVGVKRLELLREVAPSLSDVVVAWAADGGQLLPAADEKELHAAAAALGVRLRFVPVQRGAGLAAGAPASVDGLVVLSSLFNRAYPAQQRSIAADAAQRGLPAVYDARSYVEAGGLMAYAANAADQYERLAALVDRILRGASPADLPIEQPTRFDLVVNLKTAQDLGLTVPQSVLLQATELIQ